MGAASLGECGGLHPNVPCAPRPVEAPAKLVATPGLRCGGRGGITQLGPTLETSPEGQARWGPHSPFSRVCRFARTRRKVCRGETRAEKRQDADVNNSPPARTQGPYRSPRSPRIPGTTHRPRASPPPRSTHLFPAPAAGPPLFALHSRGCRGRAAGPGCGWMRRGPAGAADQPPAAAAMLAPVM